MSGGCAICGAQFFPPTGALCAEHQEVADSFTPKMWKRIEAMTVEQANAFLLKRQAQLAARRPAPETSEVEG